MTEVTSSFRQEIALLSLADARTLLDKKEEEYAHKIMGQSGSPEVAILHLAQRL